MNGRRRALSGSERADVQSAQALPFRPHHLPAPTRGAGDYGPAPAPGPAEFREVLGNFATGVTVITALDGPTPVGFTCQAFTSLSLNPPLISFSVSRESSTRPRILRVGRFCVNVLAFDQHTMCARFATPAVDRFDGTDWWRSPGGSPVLDGSLAWIDCTVEAEYPAGDHTIVVGHVRALAVQREAAPLVYHRGAFANCFPFADTGALPRVC